MVEIPTPEPFTLPDIHSYSLLVGVEFVLCFLVLNESSVEGFDFRV